MPKHDTISQELRAEIACGRYEASGRLPSEAQFVERFGVSRPTIARALRDLQAEGLIQFAKRGQDWRVQFVDVNTNGCDPVFVPRMCASEGGSQEHASSGPHLVDTLTPHPYSDTLNRLTYSDTLSRLTYSDTLNRLTYSDTLSRLTYSDTLNRLTCSDTLNRLTCSDTLNRLTYSDTLNRLAYSLRRQPMKAVRLSVSE